MRRRLWIVAAVAGVGLAVGATSAALAEACVMNTSTTTATVLFELE